MLTGCLAGTMLLGTMAMTAQAINVSQLKDVEPTSWYYSHVKYVAEHNYMTGVTADTFAPMREMTRAMFVTTLARLDGVKAGTAKTEFEDVAADSWYASSVQWAVANGIITGVSATRFAPDSSITREQMCTMMARFIQYRAEKENKTFVGSVTETTFPDADKISSYAVEAVKQCQRWGLIYGDEDGYLNPQNNATRAQVAAVLQRLDTLLAAGQSNGGGAGGGGGSTGETANYTIKLKLDVPGSVSTTDPELSVTYNNVTINGTSVSGDKTLSQVMSDLTAGENANVLRNGISEIIGKVMGKTFTETVNGQLVSVSINQDGKISASVSMKVTDLTGTRTRVSQQELEDLILKLQNGGSMTFTKAEVPVMEELLAKANELDGMSDEQIEAKMQEYAAGNPALEQALEGMTVTAVRDAVKDYADEITEIKDEVNAAPGESIVIEKPPVVMSVAMNLGTYYNTAVSNFESRMDSVIDRMEQEIGKTLTAAQREKAEALYNTNHPVNYVTNNNDGTLTLKTADEYFNVLKGNSDASMAFYSSLNEDEVFYQGLLDRLENKYQDGYGITYSIDGLADVLGDTDGILVNESYAFRNDTTFSITANVNETTYSKWAELLSGKFDFLDGILPGQLPAGLNALLGEYTITFTIDKQ